MAVIVAEPCCSLLFQQHCSTNHVVHYCFNNIVQRTMLFNEQCCSILFQQCCSTNNVVHYCFNNVVQKQCCSIFFEQRSTNIVVHYCFTVVETGENNIDRTSLFVIVIIIEQCCNNIVFMAKQPCLQHCSLCATQ